jgi:hypothetical protein
MAKVEQGVASKAEKLGRKAEASAGILDSQSVKTAEGSEARGYDANKRCLGRKRHILVDTLGLLLCVLVSSAKMQDRDGAKALLAGFYGYFFQSFRLKRIWRMKAIRVGSSPGLMKPVLGCSTSSGATSRQAFARSCPNAGLLNGPSPGLFVVAVSPEMMSVYPRVPKPLSTSP